MNSKTHIQLNARIPKKVVEQTRVFSKNTRKPLGEIMTLALEQYFLSFEPPAKEPAEESPFLVFETHTEPQIDRGIPIPENPKRSDKYSFMKKMEIGDSVFLPDSAKNSVHNAASRAGITVIMRTVQNGIRVWRTA